MPIIANQKLYNEVKNDADKIYKKSSAYKSGWIVKEYKKRGGTYIDDNNEKNLKRWFEEKWGDIGGQEYPVYRPFKRINENTPLTVNEIDPNQAIKQINLKQKIKGKKNLPPFKGRGLNKIPIQALKILKSDDLYIYSNPIKAQKKAFEYLGDDAYIYKSLKPEKKYMIFDPINNKWVHFGQMGFEDYNKHNDFDRMLRYRNRAENIKGNWRDNPYSPNNLSINILW